MKRILTATGMIIAIIAGLFLFFNPAAWVFAPRSEHERIASVTSTLPTTDTATHSTSVAPVQTLAQNLSVPWGLAFLPDGNLLVTERTGGFTEITQSGRVVNTQKIPTATPIGEGGLLGVAVHPDFSNNRQIYIYETFGTDNGTRNRVVRFDYINGELRNRVTIIEDLQGALYHDGGRIAFGPDGYLFVTVGDAGNPSSAQATSSLNGAILRLQPDGKVPESNPFSNAVYSYGHRNPQGLAWSQNGQLFATEHGRSGIRSGLDEVNLIKAGANYGWPYFEGDEVCGKSGLYNPPAPKSLSGERCNVVPPLTHSGPDITWAPASAAIANNTLFFGGLRGQAIYAAPIQNGMELRLGEITAYFKEEFGRIRTVKAGPGGEYLYITTSNTDGRGNPQTGDDKLIRIDLELFD